MSQEAPPKPLSVLLVAPRYHTNQLGWVRGLVATGCRVTLCVERVGFAEDHSDVVPIPLYSGEGTSLLSRIQAAYTRLIQLHSTARQAKVDVFVVRSGRNSLTFLAICAAKLSRTPCVLYIQAPQWRRHLAFSKRIQMWVLHTLLGFTIITPIEYRATDFGFRLRKVSGFEFVPFACPRIRQDEISDPNLPMRLLGIGKFDERKQHLELIGTAARLKRSGLEFLLLIVGECQTQVQMDYLVRCQEAIADAGLESCVQIATNLSHNDCLKFMETSDIFVLNSRDEPAAVSLLEAMGMGVAVVCSSDNGTASYVGSGSGFVCHSPGELSEALSLLIQNPSLVFVMKVASRGMASTVYSPEQVGQSLVKILADVSGRVP